jgi:hypothetical protein
MCVLKGLEAIFAICCISGLFFEGREIGRALFSDQSMLWPSIKKIQKHGNPDYVNGKKRNVQALKPDVIVCYRLEQAV